MVGVVLRGTHTVVRLVALNIREMHFVRRHESDLTNEH
jgi:hypothetical protein